MFLIICFHLKTCFSADCSFILIHAWLELDILVASNLDTNGIALHMGSRGRKETELNGIKSLFIKMN